MKMEYDILVDGYNVIKKNAMFQMMEIKNMALARDTLIRQLKNRYRYTTDRVIVVFDGSDGREQTRHDDHIRIIFSRYGETADSVIARLAKEARQAGRKIILYSDDCEVKQSVREQGGSPQSAQQLTARLKAAPADLEARVKHRLAMRKLYGIDPWYKAIDELDDPYPQPQKHKKKHKKKRY